MSAGATLETQNAHVLATMQIPDLTERLPEIDITTLVFWGTEDRFVASGTWKVLGMKGMVQAELRESLRALGDVGVSRSFQRALPVIPRQLIRERHHEPIQG